MSSRNVQHFEVNKVKKKKEKKKEKEKKRFLQYGHAIHDE